MPHRCFLDCEDTADWGNGYTLCGAVGLGEVFCTSSGWTCDAYAVVIPGHATVWCANATVVSGMEWAVGPSRNYPEENCCVCGKGNAGR